MQWFLENWHWIVIIGFVAFLVFDIVRYVGYRSSIFGAKIERTLGTVEGKTRDGKHMKLNVHVLSSKDGDDFVGVEYAAKKWLYWMVPIILSASEAHRLGVLLTNASPQRDSHNQRLEADG